MIFYRKGQKGVNKKGAPIMYDLEDKINFSVFRSASRAVPITTRSRVWRARKQAASPEFERTRATMRNMHAMSERLKSHGIDGVSGGTDNHLVLADLAPPRETLRVERVLERRRTRVQQEHRAGR